MGRPFSCLAQLLSSNQAKPQLTVDRRATDHWGKEKGPTRWVDPFNLAPPAGLELGKAVGFAND